MTEHQERVIGEIDEKIAESERRVEALEREAAHEYPGESAWDAWERRHGARERIRDEQEYLSGLYAGRDRLLRRYGM